MVTGSDVTVVGWGSQLGRILQATESASGLGSAVRVCSLRCLIVLRGFVSLCGVVLFLRCVFCFSAVCFVLRGAFLFAVVLFCAVRLFLRGAFALRGACWFSRCVLFFTVRFCVVCFVLAVHVVFRCAV